MNGVQYRQRVDDISSFVKAAVIHLSHELYNDFDVWNVPSQFSVDFIYIIHSHRFTQFNNNCCVDMFKL